MKINNYTLMNSNYDETTGVSTVTINTDVGVFTGTSKCHPDEKYKSKFFGCQIAEGRALLAYQRELVKIGHAQLTALFNLNTTVCQMTDYQKDNMYTSKIRRAMYEKQAWIEERKKKIEETKNAIKIMIAARDEYVEKVGK